MGCRGPAGAGRFVWAPNVTRVFPLHDENPTSTRSWVTIALIIVNIVVFVWIQPRDMGPQDVEFVYEYAAIPCEVIEGRPLTVAENPLTNGGADGVCGVEQGTDVSCVDASRGANCTIFPDKSVWLSVRGYWSLLVVAW